LRWNLPSTEMPTAWFNVVPHMDAPPEPPLHPATRQPVGPDDLAPLFPMALIDQEVTTEPYVDIPGEVLDVLGLWRPTPLVRAERLEKRSALPPASTTRTSLSPRLGPTSPTQRSRKPSTTKPKGRPVLPRRRVQANGAVPCASLRPSSAWSARFTWCGRRTSKNPIGGC
jgi:hypothetical protein